MTLAAILALIAEISERSPPKIKLPHGLVLPVAFAAETMARFSGRPPLVTVDGVRLARKRMFFSHARASSELGYSARGPREALSDAIAWYTAQGYLPSGRRP